MISASSLAPGRETSGRRLGAYLGDRYDHKTGRPAIFRLTARITSDELPDPVITELEATVEVEYRKLGRQS
jgi:hypothetical protein